ncbi:hypothetical protein SISNIDRAFT_168058 [Sistotremastrum niveocremeum HHB9708]|uniref:F-box domain-containing protein n=1 Tax=Sistotremastrum niveocremeum HHB9708 TaxID=1314777 RepID=A0A164SC72_9AGAM|nr:hypothetical protein SISNIDRAFT_168058 [Sistotremastrum niveocremeum HHB9708]
MDGLQSLVLRGPPWPEDASVITDFLISSIPANTLLKFHVLEYLNSAILQFLQQQNKLQFLSLHECDGRDNLTTSLQSPQMMPTLKRLELIFTQDDNRFQELVEARPITVFHLSTVVLLPPCWSTFAPRLHALDISNSYIREYQIGEVLETLSTTAVNLRLFACFQVNYFPGF